MSLSKSTASFYLHPRSLLLKLPNYRPPIDLVHRRQPKHPYSTPSPNDRFVVCKHKYYFGDSWNFKYTRIPDDGRFGKVVDGEFAWWDLCFFGSWEIVRRIDVEAKNVGSSSLLVQSDSVFLCRFSGLIQFVLSGHYMWRFFLHLVCLKWSYQRFPVATALLSSG